MIWRVLKFLFTLPPVAYFVLAPLLVVGAGASYIWAGQDDADRAKAVARGMPQGVLIEEVMSRDSGYAFNEILVAGQLDLDNSMIVTRTKRGRERSRKELIPIYPSVAEDFTGPMIGVLEIGETFSDEAFEGMIIGEGPVGYIFGMNGKLVGSADSDARRAFDDIGKPLAETVYTVELYEKGRDMALKPLKAGNAFLSILLVLAAGLGGYGFFRKRSLEKQALEEQTYYEDEGNRAT